MRSVVVCCLPTPQTLRFSPLQLAREGPPQQRRRQRVDRVELGLESCNCVLSVCFVGIDNLRNTLLLIEFWYHKGESRQNTLIDCCDPGCLFGMG